MQPSFGNLLRRYRLTAGLTQEELASRSGVSVRAIRSHEIGQRQGPRSATLRLLCQALDLDRSATAELFHAARPELDAWPGASQAANTGEASRMGSSRLTPPPLPLTSLVGRAWEIEAITEALEQGVTRLLTVTGPPGIGKTRIATEVAVTLRSHFADGVAFVSLAPVMSAALVVPQVFEDLGLSLSGGAGETRDLAATIGDARLLLVLDNMEHLLTAAIQFPELLRSCPNLAILATSRAPLRVTGERRFQLSAMSLAPAGEAEQLFLARARDADVEIASSADMTVLSSICQRLDGLPLAIELAAAQLGTRSLSELATDIENILPELTGGPRDQPERLQSMIQSLEWSHSLLSPEEQRLLRRLSVFRGSFGLDAVEAVCSEEPLHPERTRHMLASLVEKNLVALIREREDRTDYAMLELIAEFAAARLEETEGTDALRRAHARYFAAMVSRHAIAYWQPSDDALPHEFARALPNFRQGMEYFETSGDAEALLRMSGDLLWFWTTTTHAQEGQEWLERSLAIGEHAPAYARANALLALGQVRSYTGGHRRSQTAYAMALDAANASGDPFQCAWACLANASVAVVNDDYAGGKALCDRALEAIALIDDGVLRNAIALWAPGTRGRADHGLGNLDSAEEQIRESARTNLTFGSPRGAARIMLAWGTLAFDRDDPEQALRHYLEAATIAYDSGDEVYAATCLRIAAAAFAIGGNAVMAARLSGATDVFESRTGKMVMWTAMDRRVLHQGDKRLRQALAPEALARETASGRQLTLAQALALAGTLTTVSYPK